MIKDTTNHVTLDHEAEYHTENEIKKSGGEYFTLRILKPNSALSPFGILKSQISLTQAY